jgi:hypothetical protein
MGMKADIGFCGILEVDIRLQVDWEATELIWGWRLGYGCNPNFGQLAFTLILKFKM